jgi:hypothetical protein
MHTKMNSKSVLWGRNVMRIVKQKSMFLSSLYFPFDTGGSGKAVGFVAKGGRTKKVFIREAAHAYLRLPKGNRVRERNEIIITRRHVAAYAGAE